MPYRKMSLLGFYDDAGTLIGVATIVADFIVEHVWHVGLFIVATSLHGSGGAAHAIYRAARALDGRAQGAQLASGSASCAGAARAPSVSGSAAGYVRGAASAGRSAMGRRERIVLRVMAKPRFSPAQGSAPAPPT